MYVLMYASIYLNTFLSFITVDQVNRPAREACWLTRLLVG